MKRGDFRRNHLLSAQDETRTHTILRPLPPQSSVYTNFTTCARAFFVPRTGLEPAHLAACAPETHWAKKKSGKRDSNSRPRPWQGRALPTELFPQSFTIKVRSFRLHFWKAGAKVLLFFDIRKFFCIFFAFFCIFLCACARPFHKNIFIRVCMRTWKADFMLKNIFWQKCPKIGKN